MGDDKLEIMNAFTAKNMSVNLRVVNPSVTTSKNGAFTIFSCHLVSKSGWYTVGEDMVPTDNDQSKGIIAAHEKKWKDQSTWTFSKMIVSQRKNAFHGCPHGFIINLRKGKFNASPYKDTAGVKELATVPEPKMDVPTLLSLSAPRIVDGYGICMKVSMLKEPTTNRKEVVRDVHIVDLSEKVITMGCWGPKADMVSDAEIGKVVYFYQAWAAIDGDGKVHLTSLPKTRVHVVTIQTPLTEKLMLRANEFLERHKEGSLTTVSATGEPRDWSTGEAASTNVSTLVLGQSVRGPLTYDLFEIAGLTFHLKGTELQTKDKKRIWADVMITDFTGSTDCFISENAALALTSTESMDEFILKAENQSLFFSRGRARIVRKVRDDGSTNFHIMHAIPTAFATIERIPVPRNDTRVLPCEVEWVQPTPAGMMMVKKPDASPLLAQGILILVKGSKDPVVVQRNGSWAIENWLHKNMKGVTTAATTQLAKFSLVAGRQHWCT
jgi:hypothetical protein